MKRLRLPPLFRVTRRVFFKIFLAFWIAMTVAGMILLGVEATRTAKLSQRWRGVTGDAFAVYAISAAQDYHNPTQKNRTVKDFLSDLEERTSIRAWIFDVKGNEVSGYASAERSRHPLWLRERMAQLVDRARTTGSSEFADLEGITLAARAAFAPDGELLVMVGTLPDRRYDFWGAVPRVQILRLLAILAAAGAVSWVLARHLTQPLDELRSVTRRLAEGDFAARADSRLDRRRDEIADLASDFNSMAARIDRLLHEQEKLLIAQRHLLADVAHELRSPLARSSVALELARDAFAEGPAANPEAGESTGISHHPNSVTESLDRIERETGNLTELIDRLLVIARLESGVQTPERTPVDLAAMVMAVAADADFEARSQSRRVCVTRCDACSMVGTSSLLRSAIENVVRNALRHTPENTSVEVSLSRVSDLAELIGWQQSGIRNGCYTSDLPELSDNPNVEWGVIAVRDYGAGVPIEELGEIFRPFYRAGSSRDRQSGGAGLGLTITARAVELHGGQLRICNADGGGLEMQFRFALVN